MNWIKLDEAIRLYEAEGMEDGKRTEEDGIKERKDFLSAYPIELIPNLTIEQYALGNKSFGHWLLYGLPKIVEPRNTFPAASGVYTTKDEPSKIRLSDTYENLFGFDYEKAFISLKNEIVNFLDDISQEKYDNFENYNNINSIMRNMLMIVYFADRFVPVRIKETLNDCLNRVSILKENENKSMVYKNLALVEWKKTVPELADWSNQIVLDFCLWLKRKDFVTNKEDACNSAVIEDVQKIEEEVNSLNVDGASKKAIINVRVNQGIFRERLLKKYSKCCMCDVETPSLLIASHIKPWVESEPEEKLDVYNGFLMCPNHDKLFDKGYITFYDDGKIKISEKLAENEKLSLNVNGQMRIELNESNKKYLKFHRENVFIDK